MWPSSDERSCLQSVGGWCPVIDANSQANIVVARSISLLDRSKYYRNSYRIVHSVIVRCIEICSLESTAAAITLAQRQGDQFHSKLQLES